MKRVAALLISLSIIFSFALPSAAKEVLSYNFDDETALSTVTNTLKNGGEVKLADGLSGKSLYLDGSYGLYLGEVSGDFTISAMVKISSSGGTDTIFFKDMDNAGNKWTGILSKSGNPSFWTHGDGNAWKTVATGDASLNRWTHIAYVEKSNVGYLYTNGTLVGSGSVAAGNGGLYLGATYWNADAPKGLADNVKLYDSAISEEEIANDFVQYIKYMIDVPKEAVADINLPTNFGTKVVVWKSSDESVITPEGAVTRYDEDRRATLTAAVDGEEIGIFDVLILKKPEKVNDEIILSYKFDENDGVIVHDKSGNGNHGAAYGGIVFDIDGAHFDGADDYIEMPKGVINGNDSITIVMKMKPGKAKQHVFAYGFGNGSDSGYIFLNPSRPDTNEIRFAGTKTNYASERAISSVPGLRRNEWATVCVAIHEKKAEMYIDGDLVMDGYMGVTVSDLGDTDKNYIAKSLYEGDPYFGGVVEEFTIYGYTMDRDEIKAFRKAEEYPAEKEREEYITSVDFTDGIKIEVDTFNRSDVKIAAVVLDDAGEVIEYCVVKPDEEIVLTKEGTICVFAFNEEENVPGTIYVKGKGESFRYEYTGDVLSVVSDKEYNDGMVIVAGYDPFGTVTGVSFGQKNVVPGEKVEFAGRFDNAVTFKLMYWNDFVSMNPKN